MDGCKCHQNMYLQEASYQLSKTKKNTLQNIEYQKYLGVMGKHKYKYKSCILENNNNETKTCTNLLIIDGRVI